MKSEYHLHDYDRLKIERKYCAITGMPLLLVDGDIVETLPGTYVAADAVAGVDVAKERSVYYDLEREIDELEAQLAATRISLEDVKYRLGARRAEPRGYRERWAMERAARRRKGSDDRR